MRGLGGRAAGRTGPVGGRSAGERGDAGNEEWAVRGLRRVRLEAAAAGAASWTGNPFLPPESRGWRRPRRNSRAGRAAPLGGRVRWRLLRGAPASSLAVPSLTLLSAPAPLLPFLVLGCLGCCLLCCISSLGRRYKLLPSADWTACGPFQCVGRIEELRGEEGKRFGSAGKVLRDH